MAEVNTITARTGNVQALAFAAKGGAALSALLAGIATAKETERKGPIQTMVFLETHFTDDEVSVIPVVGSKQGETGNKPYDRYTTEITTKDGKKKVPGSWFTDVVKSTDEYAQIDQRLRWLNNEGDNIPDEISRMGAGQKAEEKARLRQRVSDMRTALTKGSMLFHHVLEIEQVNPEKIAVKLPVRKVPVLDADGKPTGEERREVYSGTIRLVDPSKELEDKVLTLGSFLALKPEKIEGEKNIANLEKTGARAPKNKTPASSAAYPIPTNIEAFLTGINAVASGFDNDKLKAALLAACAKPGKDGDEAVLSVGNLCMAADGIWTVINKRYEMLTSQKAAALNTKTAA